MRRSPTAGPLTVCLARPTAGTVSVCEKLEHPEPANLLGSEMQLLCLKQTRLHVRAVPMSSCGDLQLSDNLERTAETAHAPGQSNGETSPSTGPQ